MILETVDMEEFETIDWEAFSRMEQASIIEALLSLECMRDSGIRETIIQHDELEEECKVHDYTDEEVEEFSEVLYTMHPEEVAGWNRSLILRGINLPNQIKDEVISFLS